MPEGEQRGGPGSSSTHVVVDLGHREGRKYTAEQLMLRRMLDDALKGAEFGVAGDWEWIFSDDHPIGTFSFQDVCDHLHLDAGYVRRLCRNGNFGRARRILSVDE